MIRISLIAALSLCAVALSHAQTPATSVAPPASTAMRAPAVPGVMPPQPSPQLDATFAQWDTDHNGALSLVEFRRGAADLRESAIETRLHAQFNAVDANRDGALDAAEYANLVLVKRAGAKAPPLSTFDGNRDGKLNFAEYTDLVRRLAPAPRSPAAPAAAPAK